MRQTEHYGLNLWDLSDRIRMDDFNGDNAKLDAAMKALENRAGVTLLNQASYTAHPTGPRIPIWRDGEPAWENYSAVLICGCASEAEAGTTPWASIKVPLNPGSTFFSTGISLDFSYGGFMYIILPFRGSSTKLEGFFLSSGQFKYFQTDNTLTVYSHIEVTALNGNQVKKINVPKLWTIGIL